jgi:hypothetical protein
MTIVAFPPVLSLIGILILAAVVVGTIYVARYWRG